MKIFRRSAYNPNTILKYPEPKRYYKDFHNVRKTDVTDDVKKIISRLAQFGHKAYIVGGSIRDLLMNRIPKDFDIVTTAYPEEIKKLFSNSKIIGKRFKIVNIYFKFNKFYEVSTTRSIPKTRLSKQITHLERDNQYGDLKEDMARRDFTINSLLFDIKKEMIIDYTGGFEDIKNKTLSNIGNENITFPEDPIRMLRAIKFATILNFTLNSKIITGITKYRKTIQSTNKDRLHEEFNKIFRTGITTQIFQKAAEYHLFKVMLPRIYQASIVNQLDDKEGNLFFTRLSIADQMIQEYEDINTTIFYTIFAADYVLAKLDAPYSLKNIQAKLQPVVKELGFNSMEFNKISNIFYNQQYFQNKKRREDTEWVTKFKAHHDFLESFIFYKIYMRSLQNNEGIQDALFWELGERKKLKNSIRKNMSIINQKIKPEPIERIPKKRYYSNKTKHKTRSTSSSY